MQKLTFTAAKQKFLDQGRTDISLLEEGYVKWKAKASFFDHVVGDNFTAIPHNVYAQKSCHPRRSLDNRKQTCVQKYGNTCSVHGTTELGLQVRKQVEETCKKKYGHKNPFQNDDIKKQIQKSTQEKYGVANISQLRKKKVAETGEYIEDWLLNQPEPKPSSYQSFGAMYLFGAGTPSEYTLEDLRAFLLSFQDHRTKLERLGESVLGTAHFNRKPSQNIKYRPDFKLSERTYVNVDGLYWHSSEQKSKNYHMEVRKAFEKEGLRIIQLHESEIRDKTPIVQSMIANTLGKTSHKIYARNTSLRELTQKEARDFLESSHLMGATSAKHVGLLCKKTNELLSVLSYKATKTGAVHIERFCSKLNCVVVGGLSKLLKQVEKTAKVLNCNQIHYWTDLRYGTATHLQKFGFELKKETLGWKWTDGHKTYNRLRCRANMDSRKMKEKEYAKELGWFRIYDAGQRLFVKSL